MTNKTKPPSQTPVPICISHEKNQLAWKAHLESRSLAAKHEFQIYQKQQSDKQRQEHQENYQKTLKTHQELINLYCDHSVEKCYEQGAIQHCITHHDLDQLKRTLQFYTDRPFGEKGGQQLAELEMILAQYKKKLREAQDYITQTPPTHFDTSTFQQLLSTLNAQKEKVTHLQTEVTNQLELAWWKRKLRDHQVPDELAFTSELICFITQLGKIISPINDPHWSDKKASFANREIQDELQQFSDCIKSDIKNITHLLEHDLTLESIHIRKKLIEERFQTLNQERKYPSQDLSKYTAEINSIVIRDLMDELYANQTTRFTTQPNWHRLDKLILDTWESPSKIPPAFAFENSYWTQKLTSFRQFKQKIIDKTILDHKIAELKKNYIDQVKNNLKLDINNPAHLSYWAEQTSGCLGGKVIINHFHKYRVPHRIYSMMYAVNDNIQFASKESFLHALNHARKGLALRKPSLTEHCCLFSGLRSTVTRDLYHVADDKIELHVVNTIK